MSIYIFATNLHETGREYAHIYRDDPETLETDVLRLYVENALAYADYAIDDDAFPLDGDTKETLVQAFISGVREGQAAIKDEATTNDEYGFPRTKDEAESEAVHIDEQLRSIQRNEAIVNAGGHIPEDPDIAKARDEYIRANEED